jgi:hypothetical protein
VPGEVNVEGRALARLAAYIDEAVVLLDHAIDGSQPQAGAFAYRLGGEERFEQVRARLGIHTAAIVAYGQQHILAGYRPQMRGAVGFVKGDDTRLDRDLAGIVDCVPGVDAEVGQHLFDLGGVHPDRAQVLGRQPGQVDVFADKLAQHT